MPKAVTRRDQTLRKKQMILTTVFVKIPDGYMGFVEELPGANTQGDTLDEARENLLEAIEMVLEGNRQLSREFMAEESLSANDVIREELVLAAV